MLADRRSDGAVMFITLMLGNDCCIFNIIINKNPVAVFALVGSACGSPNASDLQDSQLWGEEGRDFLALRDTRHEQHLHFPSALPGLCPPASSCSTLSPDLLEQNCLSYVEVLGDLHRATEQIPEVVKQTSLK